MENPVRQQAAACAVVLPEPEQWKDIAGYEGLYQVSDLGRVKSLERIVPVNKGVGRNLKGSQTVSEKFLKADLSRGFYPAVTLSYKGRTFRKALHILVARAFIPNPQNKPIVNHIYGDKLDARAKNLEWCTSSENEIHSYKSLGKINPQRKFAEKDVEFIRNYTIKGNTGRGRGNVKEIAAKFDVSINAVLNVVNRRYYV